MNDPDILPQQRREKADPYEAKNPIPWYVLMVVALTITFGVVYIARSAHLETPSDWGDGRVAAELTGERKASGAKADGAAIYASLCAACHQANGGGLPGVFPPLAGSEWVNGKETVVASIVLHGVTGEISVKGGTFNGAMPAFKEQLDDDQLAAVLTHLRSQWGNSSPAVSRETVAKVREQLKERKASFAGGKELAGLQ